MKNSWSTHTPYCSKNIEFCIVSYSKDEHYISYYLGGKLQSLKGGGYMNYLLFVISE